MGMVLGLSNYEMMLERRGSISWLRQPRDVWWACSGSVLAQEEACQELAFLHTLAGSLSEVWLIKENVSRELSSAWRAKKGFGHDIGRMHYLWKLGHNQEMMAAWYGKGEDVAVDTNLGSMTWQEKMAAIGCGHDRRCHPWKLASWPE